MSASEIRRKLLRTRRDLAAGTPLGTTWAPISVELYVMLRDCGWLPDRRLTVQHFDGSLWSYPGAPRPRQHGKFRIQGGDDR